MNTLRELMPHEIDAVAGAGVPPIALVPDWTLRPPPFPMRDIVVKPQPVPWIPGRG